MSERILLAAQGYLELGMVEEALAELSSFSGPFAQDPDIVELRLHIQMQGERWNDALTSAEELLRITPDAVPAFIHGAFALHEMGRTSEARDLLLKGPPVLKNDPTFHYNIGCKACNSALPLMKPIATSQRGILISNCSTRSWIVEGEVADRRGSRAPQVLLC